METSSVDLAVLFSCNNSCSVLQLGAVRSLFSDSCWLTLLPDKGSSRKNFFQEYRLILHFKKCLFFLEKISLYLRKQNVLVVGDLLMLRCKVATKDVLGESGSLLWSVFGKVMLYLSCAICLCSILWKCGSEPTWETSHICQATKWVTDERWNKSLSNTTRCLRDRAEAIRWAHMGKLCYPGAALPGQQ